MPAESDSVLPQDLAALYQRRYHVLAEFGKDAIQNIDLQQLLDQAVLRLSQSMRVQHTKILQYRPDTADLLVVAGHGWREGVIGRERLRSDLASPAGRAVQTAQPVTLDDLRNAHDVRVPALLAEHGIVSMSNVPIMADGMVWGVLEVDSDKPRHFTAAETDFLTAFSGFLGSAIQRRKVEDEAERVASAKAADSAHTDLLLRELQHRMKNNLQMILSLISMQKRKANAAEAHDALDHIAERVTAIVFAQDQLSMSGRLRTVGLGAYLRALCSYIETGREDVVIESKADDIELPIDQAVPAGLIVNEAVTNAVKYAFPSGRRGSIQVMFTSDQATRTGKLLIADDGVGMEGPHGSGSGLDLMNGLAAQLGGEIAYGSPPEGGTIIELVFPMRL